LRERDLSGYAWGTIDPERSVWETAELNPSLPNRTFRHQATLSLIWINRRWRGGHDGAPMHPVDNEDAQWGLTCRAAVRIDASGQRRFRHINAPHITGCRIPKD
jgi:hypothetical protein